MYSLNSLSVVVPVKNEAGNLAPLITEIDQVLSKIEHEIIYVDDGSTDQTANELRSLCQTFTQLRVITHAESCGQSTAVRTGVKYAAHDWIVTLDGDGQNDPADIPTLLNAIGTGIDLVGGNRRASRKDTWVKRMSSVIANTVRSTMLKDDTPDTGCGLKLFRRKVFLDLPYFDHMHRFLPALFKRNGSQIVSVPVQHRQRQHGRSNYGTIDRLLVGMIDLLGVAWLQRRNQIPVIKQEEHK